MNKKKSTGILLSILGVISLVLITAGVTYAFFTYAKEGQTENTLSTGTITFHYDEKEGNGNGIKITDALPMSDETGKELSGNNNVFNFTITSKVAGKANIPYEVTLRKKADSTLGEDQIKVYLTATGSENAGTNNTTKDTTVPLYSALPKPDVTISPEITEKQLYKGTVPKDTESYVENFTLKMWVKGSGDGEDGVDADYSPYEFVLKTAAQGTNALDADTLIATKAEISNHDDLTQLITSTTYYALDEDTKALYERIAYVNQNARKIWTVTQASKEPFTAGDGFVAGEQFYKLNNQTFTVTVNVYANATVVTE